MNTIKKIKGYGIILTFGLFTAVISYAINLLFIRTYSDEQYGYLAKIIIWSGMISVFVTYETNAIAQKLFIKLEYSISSLFKSIHAVRFINFMFILLLSVLLSKVIDSKFALLVLVYLLSTFNFSYIFESQRDNEYYAMVHFSERLIYGAISYVLTNFCDQLLDVVLYAVIFSSIASISIQYLKIKDKLIDDKGGISLTIKMIYKENIYFVINAYAMFLFGNVSKLMLEDKIGLAGLGVYNFCWQIVTLSTFFSAIMQKLLRLKSHQFLFNGDIKSIEQLYLKMFVLAMGCIFALNLLLVLFQSSLLSIINRPGRGEIVQLMHIFSIYLIITSFEVLNEIINVEYNNKNNIYINLLFGVTMLLIIYVSNSSNVIYYAFLVTLVQLISMAVITFSNVMKIKLNGKGIGL